MEAGRRAPRATHGRRQPHHLQRRSVREHPPAVAAGAAASPATATAAIGPRPSRRKVEEREELAQEHARATASKARHRVDVGPEDRPKRPKKGDLESMHTHARRREGVWGGEGRTRQKEKLDAGASVFLGTLRVI